MPTVPEISIEKLKENLSNKAITVLDIRDVSDYEAGHIADAISITNAILPTFIEQADKTKRYAICCYHGNSSQTAVLYLQEIGFKDVASVTGGYAAWASQ